MFFGFFNLFASIVLLPIYLQTLMGYTATLAGWVLGPGGIATMITLIITGRLIARINPKIILSIGVVVCAYATYLMSKFNLYADFYTVSWPRIVLGIGMGFFFVPLTTLTMSGIKKEEMGNATAVYNLLRNLGGSFGVAFVTTILSQRAQFHQFRLVEHLTPFDRNYKITTEHIAQIINSKGLIEPLQDYASLSVIYRELLRQASMMSFNDAFYMTSMIMVCILPLVFLMKKGGGGIPPGMH
jgi:DHA2 family multidrug resistance protein